MKLSILVSLVASAAAFVAPQKSSVSPSSNSVVMTDLLDMFVIGILRCLCWRNHSFSHHHIESLSNVSVTTAATIGLQHCTEHGQIQVQAPIRPLHLR